MGECAEVAPTHHISRGWLFGMQVRRTFLWYGTNVAIQVSRVKGGLSSQEVTITKGGELWR
jgi:hypothetical protein